MHNINNNYFGLNRCGSEDVKTVVEDILAAAPVRGSKDARFTILEYTELHCPYCQRHAQNGTIQAVLDKFPGEVNSVSRHYIIHGEGAQKLAAAMECVSELKADAYYDVFEAAFDAYPVDMDGLVEIAVNKGVNKSKLHLFENEESAKNYALKQKKGNGSYIKVLNIKKIDEEKYNKLVEEKKQLEKMLNKINKEINKYDEEEEEDKKSNKK